MSKEVKRCDELKALAEGMDGWPNKAAFECDDAWCVGAIDEDANLYPVIEIQTEQYDAFDASEPMAKYYAAANPSAILELLAERDALLAERDAAQKDAERYRLLASTLLADCNGTQMTPQEGALYRALNAIEHVNSTAEIDAVFDAALQGEQP